jgi:glycosyltransferase involved in cell wall biosynthesis
VDRPKPRLSILINNFNYARYLPQAIDSALAQTYQPTQVIVVDDGSTDDSRAIIEQYRDRITPALKSNGGQASAMNAGFLLAEGDIVIFLDADDTLLPETAGRVAQAFRSRPHLARIQYRVEIMDEGGRPTGTVVPPPYLSMPSGDLRRALRRLSNYAWAPTSGHAFSAWSLRSILPIPEAEFRLFADYYLLRANSLAGPIQSLDMVGAYYRSHGGNRYHASRLDLKQIQGYVRLVEASHPHLRRVAAGQGLRGYPERVSDLVDAFFLAQCLVLRRLGRNLDPLPGQRTPRLVARGAQAALSRPDATPLVRLLGGVWFPMMWLAPPPIAARLAELFLYPEARRWMEGVLGGAPRALAGA